MGIRKNVACQMSYEIRTPQTTILESLENLLTNTLGESGLNWNTWRVSVKCISNGTPIKILQGAGYVIPSRYQAFLQENWTPGTNNQRQNQWGLNLSPTELWRIQTGKGNLIAHLCNNI